MPVLFQRRTVLTRERNPCHQPAGSEAGGEFAPKGQGICRGDLPVGQGRYGPAERGAVEPETLSRQELLRSIPPPGKGAIPQWLREELHDAAEVLEESFLAHDGKDSKDYYKTGDNYSATRDATHQEILNELFAEAKPATGQPVIIFMGGLPGAGKTHAVLSKMNTKGMVVINADDLKEELPEYNGNNAKFLHEESSDLKTAALRIAAGSRYNVIFDGTMAGAGSVRRTMDIFKKAGYRIEVRLVDVPIAHSYKSALTRFYQGQVEYRQSGKKGIRGRWVPPEFITDSADAKWGSAPRATLEAIKGELDAWSIVDGRTGRTVDSRGKLREATSWRGLSGLPWRYPPS